MKSPFTNKEMKLLKEKRSMVFRKENFEVQYHYYLCEKSGEQFTDSALDELNIIQVYNQYREAHNLPFPDEIKAIREKYGLSAAKMSEVLCFGVNMYRSYETGEIPSDSNGRLIQLAADSREFKKLVLLSKAFESKDLEKLIKRIDQLIQDDKRNRYSFQIEKYLLEDCSPDAYTGYRKPSLERLTEMVVYFTETLQPYKTKMNKLLFYADFLNYKHTGYSISGVRYRAIDRGPVPNNFNSLFDHMARKEDIDIHFTSFAQGTGEQFRPCTNRKFKKDLFDDQELTVIEKVANHFKSATTKTIVDISHDEKAWIDNFNDGKKLINYTYGFELKEV